MATIKDVAREAGVSTATVSHVINGTRFVSDEVRSRVKDAMEKFQYVPNISAYSLRTQKTKTISLLIPILINEADCIFFMQLARGVESVMRKRQYFTVLGNTNEDGQREREEIQHGVNRMVDGMLIAPVHIDHSYVEALTANLPIVYVDRIPQNVQNYSCVYSDTHNGTRDAIRELIALGHQKIAMIETPLILPDERIKGYEDAMREKGLYDPELVQYGPCTFDEGYTLAKQLLEKRPDITAFFMATNLMAMGAMRYLHEQGIRVPEDMSILVFDDYEWTRMYDPPLTVLRQDAVGIGKKAAELLLERIADSKEHAPEQIRLPLELVKRGSWDKPREHSVSILAKASAGEQKGQIA